MKFTLNTSVHDFGHMVDEIVIETEGNAPQVTAEDFTLSECYRDISGRVPCHGVKSVEVSNNTVKVSVDAFLYGRDFTVECTNPDLSVKVTKENAETTLYHEDMFNAYVENGVYYRIHEPEATAPRPLVLFLHGAGGCGEDNMGQLTDTLGAIKLAERWPDMYIMAPQAPANGMTMAGMFAKMMAKGDPFKIILGSDTDNDKGDRGWNRDYLGRVGDIIRNLIAAGKVDAQRVYVIGMSMGGGGTLKMISVAPDLFAASVCICPSMNGEAWPILANLPEVPMYVAGAYIDSHVARHAYMARAVQQLLDNGRKDIRFTLFAPEELEAYGIGVNKNLTTQELYTENHNCWILVLHNEYGILDWMISHKKK